MLDDRGFQERCWRASFGRQERSANSPLFFTQTFSETTLPTHGRRWRRASWSACTTRRAGASRASGGCASRCVLSSLLLGEMVLMDLRVQKRKFMGKSLGA